MRHSGLNQTKLAKRSGVSRATINRILQAHQAPEQDTVERLGQAMKYELGHYLTETTSQTLSESSAKRDRAAPGVPYGRRKPRTQGRRVSEPDIVDSGGFEDPDAAYLRFTLQMTRELSAAEREGATPQTLLRLVDLAEKVAVPIHGLRAKQFLEAERARIRRGEKLDNGGGS